MTPERLAEIRSSVEHAPEWSAFLSEIDRHDLLAEVDRLLRWKSEATEVLNAWENVWVAAGEPGRLGESKAKATAAEVDRLRAENARAMECFDRDQKAIADLQAERGRLRAQVMNLNRWVDRVTLKRITTEAIERGARSLFASRYFGDEDFADEETARIYYEEAEGCIRAALASGDGVQS